MSHDRTLAYDLKRHPGPTGLRVEAIFTCATCGKHAVLNVGEVHNPQKLGNRLKQHGWYGGAWHARRDITCPECLVASRTRKNDAASELRKYAEKKARQVAQAVVSTPALAALASTQVKLTETTISLPREPDQKPEHHAMAQITKMKPLSGETPPSSDARIAIRVALDKSFDDKQGIYLDGMSDEKIASDLDFPRKWVSDIREAAYGPIRERPEISALKSEIEKLKHELEDLTASLLNKQDKLSTRLAELIAQADAIGRKVG